MTFQILDCTLRDGGYYTNWNFSEALVKRYLDGIEKSGITLVELGYKSPTKSGFYGLYKYCPESQLQHLKTYKTINFAFMIDVKEFLDAHNTLDEALLKSCVPLAKQSVFSWCRIATHPSTIDQANELTTLLKKRGYTVCLNIMGSSLLSMTQLVTLLNTIHQDQLEVLYLADSYGHFMPNSLTTFITEIKPHIHTNLGFHAHDNQGLAYANALSAIDAGATYIDATVLGMGRGAGNLRTEQILLGAYFNFNATQYTAFPILESVEQDFKPLKDTHHWGEDFSYTLSGIENIHPTYCQSLKSAHQYSIPQVSEILKSIPKQNRHKFNNDSLLRAINTVIHKKKDHDNQKKITKHHTPKHHDTVLILANGPNLKTHLAGVQAYINDHQPLVIQCNAAKYPLDAKHHITAVLNEVRLSECKAGSQIIVTGLEKTPKNTKSNVQHYPYQLKANTFNISNSDITIPSFLVGGYAFGLALLATPKTVVLAGFDGFDTQTHEHIEMNQLFELILASKWANKIEYYSLLPTKYDIPVQPVYAHLS